MRQVGRFPPPVSGRLFSISVFDTRRPQRAGPLGLAAHTVDQWPENALLYAPRARPSRRYGRGHVSADLAVEEIEPGVPLGETVGALKFPVVTIGGRLRRRRDPMPLGPLY